MRRHQRRLNWVRDTRDPAVAEAYDRSAEASAAWSLALAQVLRGHGDDDLPSEAPRVPIQLVLPLGEGFALPSERNRPDQPWRAAPAIRRVPDRAVAVDRGGRWPYRRAGPPAPALGPTS
jgi:hypothetical protein